MVYMSLGSPTQIVDKESDSGNDKQFPGELTF